MQRYTQAGCHALNQYLHRDTHTDTLLPSILLSVLKYLYSTGCFGLSPHSRDAFGSMKHFSGISTCWDPQTTPSMCTPAIIGKDSGRQLFPKK